MLGKLVLVAGAGVVALGGALDVAVKNTAEEKIAEQVEAAAGGRAEATADIDSFPFLLRLLVSGSAGDISLHVEDVATSAVELSTVDLDLEGVRLDRSRLLSDRKAELVEIDRGTLAVGIDAAAISTVLRGLPVTIADGRVVVQVAGRAQVADLTLGANGSLRIGVPGGPAATIAVPQSDLVSCQASALRVEDDEVRLSCTLTEVPPALLRAAQRAAR